ncbi:ATP-binding protein, partial [Streptomyces anthocyanicus]
PVCGSSTASGGWRPAAAAAWWRWCRGAAVRRRTVRHAHAGTAEITLSHLGDHVALDVVDDGTGFDPDALPPPDPEAGGFGLAAMRARLDALGGTLSIESAPGHGTALAARLPLVPPTEPEAHP